MRAAGRAVKKDMVVGIVGTVILVAAMVGVFNYEAGRGGGQSWRVSWSEAEEAGPQAEGTAQAGGTAIEDLNVTAANVTRATFTLTWTDDVGAPDTFNLTISAPDGTMRWAEGSNGEVEVVFEGLAPMPGEMTFLAATQEEAEARAARDATTFNAVGVWGASVLLASAPGTVSPGGGIELPPDGANAWTLTVTLTTYRPSVEQG